MIKVIAQQCVFDFKAAVQIMEDRSPATSEEDAEETAAHDDKEELFPAKPEDVVKRFGAWFCYEVSQPSFLPRNQALRLTPRRTTRSATRWR